MSICKPTEDYDGFHRNGEGDEVLFVHHGSGVVETISEQSMKRLRKYRWPGDVGELHSLL